MLDFFKKKKPEELLQKKYEKLLEEAYQLSHKDRKASDQKMLEADEVMKEIVQLKGK